jgi:photosystem II stability/assembly factor-like uncharacterized protein
MKTKRNLLLLFLFFTTGYANAQWALQRNFGMLTELHGIQFIDETHGWIWSEGMYLSTTNGGQTWSIYSNWMEEPPNDLFFMNRDTGFMAAQNGIVRKTTNGGLSWQNVQTPVQDPIYRLFFVNETHGWGNIGQYNFDSRMVRTSNGGETWAVLETGIEKAYRGYFTNSLTGWIIGQTQHKGHILKTIDGGNNFTLSYASDSISFFCDIYATLDNLIIWVCGASNNRYLLLLSTNGGFTWQDHSLPLLKNRYNQMEEAKTITSIQFMNDTLGWITCWGSVNGYVLLTTDGGITWQQQLIECGNNWGTTIFQDISMISPKKGWIVSVGSIFTTNQADTAIVLNIGQAGNLTEGLSVYPNPFADNVTIKFPNGLQPTEIVITDITGKILMHENYRGSNTFNTSFIESGIYFLTINFFPNNTHNSLTTKIIKL